MPKPLSASNAEIIHFIADDGEPVAVHVAGEGPALVMLHGWTASHAEWQMLTGELACHYRVYQWDARGHGGHALRTATIPTVARMAQDLSELMTHFGLAQVTLVGHSMGALTAWEYVRQFGTARLARICLIDQSPKLMTDAEWGLGIYGDFDAGRAARFTQSLEQDFVQTVLQLSAFGLNDRARKSFMANSRGWQNERSRLARLTPAPLIATWNSLVQADYRALLPLMTLPVLLIYGNESNFYPLQTAHYVHSQLPQASLQIYAGTDHCPHLWQPSRFVRDLLQFSASPD